MDSGRRGRRSGQANLVTKARTDVAEADVALLFTPDRAAFDAKLPALLKNTQKIAILWIAYPKLTTKLACDLSRDVIHKLAPDHGLHAVAQISIDDDWSALRLKRT